MFRTYALFKRLPVSPTRAPVPWKGTVFRHWTCCLFQQATLRKPRQCKPWLIELWPMKLLDCSMRSTSTDEEDDPIVRLDPTNLLKQRQLQMNPGSPAVAEEAWSSIKMFAQSA